MEVQDDKRDAAAPGERPAVLAGIDLPPLGVSVRCLNEDAIPVGWRQTIDAFISVTHAEAGPGRYGVDFVLSVDGAYACVREPLPQEARGRTINALQQLTDKLQRMCCICGEPAVDSKRGPACAAHRASGKGGAKVRLFPVGDLEKAPVPSDGQFQVFDQVHMRKALRRLSEDRENFRREMEISIQTLGSARPHAGIARPAREIVEQLASEMPNCRSIIRQAIQPALTFADVTGRLKLPMLLAHGQPGTGKSRLWRRLAELAGLPYERLDLGAIDMAGAIVGTDCRWSNSTEGAVFRVLVFGPHAAPVANPLVIVEEIDKISASRHHPVAPALLMLLERSTAVRFEDRSLPGVTLNASAINWVFTANELQDIPAPLLSRLMPFEVQPLTPEERVDAARRVFLEAVHYLATEGVQIEPVISATACERLAALPLRQLRQSVDVAIANVVGDGRTGITDEDVVPLGEPTRGRSAGFH